MRKKYLHIIALSAIMGLCGNSYATPECYKHIESQKKTLEERNKEYQQNCIKDKKCFWVAFDKYCAEGPNTYACDSLKKLPSCINNPICSWKISENKCLEKECHSLTSGSCSMNQKCSWSSTQNKCSEKESSPSPLLHECELEESLCKKNQKCSWNIAYQQCSMKEISPPQNDSVSKKTVPAEPLCTKNWFKTTCNSASKSKKIDCVWLKSSSTTNAGQKSGCHSRSEFYEKNKEYFDIDSSFLSDSNFLSCEDKYGASCRSKCSTNVPKIKDKEEIKTCIQKCITSLGECLKADLKAK